MILVVGKKAWRTIAVIDNLVPRGLQPINQPGGTQGRRGFLAAEGEGCGARGRANQSNLVPLTDDLDRQVRLLVLQLSGGRAAVSMTNGRIPHPLEFFRSSASPAERSTTKPSAARRRRDGRQFRRQGEPDVLADQIQVALIGKAKLRQALAHLLDKNFRCGSACRQSHA